MQWRGIYYTFRSFPPPLPPTAHHLFFLRQGGCRKFFEFLTLKDAFLSRFSPFPLFSLLFHLLPHALSFHFFSPADISLPHHHSMYFAKYLPLLQCVLLGGAPRAESACRARRDPGRPPEEDHQLHPGKLRYKLRLDRVYTITLTPLCLPFLHYFPFVYLLFQLGSRAKGIRIFQFSSISVICRQWEVTNTKSFSSLYGYRDS